MRARAKKGGRERARQRDRQRQRDRETERQRDRETERQTETDRDRQKERELETERQREMKRDRISLEEGAAKGTFGVAPLGKPLRKQHPKMPRRKLCNLSPPPLLFWYSW